MSTIGCSVSSCDDALHTAIYDNDSEVSKNNTKRTSEVRSPIIILPQKAVILQMQDFDKLENKVANALIKAMPKCDLTTIKTFELIVSAINPKNPPEDCIVYIEKELLFEFLGLNSSTKARDLERKLMNFRDQLHFNFSVLDDEEREAINQIIARDEPDLVPLHKKHIVSAANEVFWEPRKSFIAFELSRRVLFFLSYLGKDRNGKVNGKNFTTYDLVGMSKFESKYSIILYRWLRMEYQRFLHTVREKGVKNKIEISISDLRKLTDTTNVYKKFSNFEARVIKTAMEEINNFSTIRFDYRKIKKGREIESIQFFVYENPKNIPAREEVLTPRKSAAERKKEQAIAYAEAMGSPYTEVLYNRGFLENDYYKNQSLMADLNNVLYPEYDKLVEEKGIEFLKKHVSKVQNARPIGKEISRPDKYLLSALEDSRAHDFYKEEKM